MAADVPNTPETSVTGAPVEDVQVSPCCQVWKNKYLKAEKGRMCLKQAVRLLEKGCDDIQVQNLRLKKAYEDEQARAKLEEEGKEKELALRVLLENELSSLKSDVSNLRLKGVSDVEHKIEEIKRLGEKKRADLEKKKSAEAAKLADSEKSKAGEEQRLADIERKKADVYRTQLEALKEEVSEAKSKFAEATKQLQEDTGNTVEERKGADLDIAKAKELRKIAETTKKAVEERKYADLEMAKVQEQRKIAEEMKKKAVEERNCANLEIAKAQEQRKNAEESKKKAVEERRHAALLMAKAKEQMKIADESKKKAVEESKNAALEFAKALEQRKIAEETKTKAVEERKCALLMAKAKEQMKIADESKKKAVEESKNAALEFAKALEQRKIAEETKTKAVEERKCADIRLAEAEKQRKIAEETMRKAVEVRKHADFEISKAEETKKKAAEEKFHANSITKQLEEARRRNEELEKKLHELSGLRNLGEDPFDQSDRNTGVAAVKTLNTTELRVLKVDEDKARSVSESLQFEEVEKGKAISERKQGDSKMRKTKNKRKLVEVNTKKAMEGKHCGDHIAKQLEDAELKINELQKQIHDLSPSRKMVDNLVVSTAKDLSAQVEMKLLKKQLKFQEKRVQHAKDVARLEKSRSNLLLQELGCMKLELIQFLDRLDALDKCFSTPAEGIDNMGKHTVLLNWVESLLAGTVLNPLQERGDFSVTTSGKLREGNLNSQPTISSMSGEITKARGNGNFAVFAENSVRSSLPVEPPGRVNHCIRGRKMILDSVESIDLLCCEIKKLQLQLEDKLSVLCRMLKGQGENSIDDAELVRRNLQDIPYTVHDRPHKRRKTSHQETEAMEKSSEGLQMKQMQSCPEHLCNPVTIDPKIMVGFEEVFNKNYMKLLDLDDAAEEECYRMAADMPVSPSLPDLEFPGIKASEVVQFRPIQDENCVRVSVENENFASSDSSMPAERACLSNPQNSGVVMMSVIPSSEDRVANIPFESEIISSVESIPKYCVVLSNIKDGSSVSRIVCATKTCMARYSLAVQTEFAVHRILQALKLEEKLLPKEKVCVFFSLLLVNFCKATLGKCSLIRDFIPCLNLFAKHVNEAMSDAESRSVFAELCVNNLLGVIEDFLIEGRVMFCTDLSSETSMEYDSRMHVLIDGLDVIFSYEAASAELLVAGSIILGSICIAADSVSFMCEAAYNIFRMRRYDNSLVLTILHVFAYVGGDKLFTLRNYSLVMTVLKSIVTFLESECVPVAVLTPSLVGDVQPQFAACVGCPFSKDALSVDVVVSLLFAELQNYTQSSIMHRDLTSNSLNPSATSSEDKAEHNLTCSLDINSDSPCCIDKYNPTGKHSGSLVTGNFCDISDVLSLMELLACNMSWDWTCKRIISQLWTMLESSSIENLNVAVVILLGQLGRLGVDAVGYEDTEVVNLRVKLSAFLRQETTIRAGLPIQLATVSALLGLVSLDLEDFHLENGDLAGMSGQPLPADVLRNWFLVLTEEQRAKSIRFIQSVG
ncbi:hypothetical protein V6N11_002704 [Hibiscus sabdariffa]|uniref:Maternal effect embryo arrest 22 n=1 Tax=Hibiscus sabdariffa TaxID=183260 RepID=A0ABR2SB80_9ROSI